MSLNKNMGTVDRIVRLTLAVLFAALIFTGTVTGILAIVAGVLAAIFVVTSIISFCPLYFPFKLSTRKKAETS